MGLLKILQIWFFNECLKILRRVRFLHYITRNLLPKKNVSILQSDYYFSFFFFSQLHIKQKNSSMTPPYFSSTSHNRFFFSSSVHRSAHENIKIRQYMFTQKYLKVFYRILSRRRRFFTACSVDIGDFLPHTQ
jgi:hypothetical protein